jgi:hypothetical protein
VLLVDTGELLSSDDNNNDSKDEFILIREAEELSSTVCEDTKLFLIGRSGVLETTAMLALRRLAFKPANDFNSVLPIIVVEISIR